LKKKKKKPSLKSSLVAFIMDQKLLACKLFN
jgi:hypothetical protein